MHLRFMELGNFFLLYRKKKEEEDQSDKEIF